MLFRLLTFTLRHDGKPWTRNAQQLRDVTTLDYALSSAQKQKTLMSLCRADAVCSTASYGGVLTKSSMGSMGQPTSLPWHRWDSCETVARVGSLYNQCTGHTVTRPMRRSQIERGRHTCDITSCLQSVHVSVVGPQMVAKESPPTHSRSPCETTMAVFAVSWSGCGVTTEDTM